MSTSSEITRLQTARNTIRTKLVALGLAQSTDKMDDLADAIDDIVNRGAVSATVGIGESYTIPAGYHSGAGTVTGQAGEGQFNLQTKTVTPSTSQQTVTPDTGNYGLSSVTVNAIPSNYKDISSTTAAPGDVLATKVFIDSSGVTQAGTMPNNGAVSKTLDATTNNQSYTVPGGYHSGSGTVGIVLEEKSATPSGSAQNITPTNGKVLSKVTVGAIPANYGDTTGDDAVAANILFGVKAHSFSSGAAVALTGSMPNNGAISATIDGLVTTGFSVPAGYTSGGTVSLTNDIETALAAI